MVGAKEVGAVERSTTLDTSPALSTLLMHDTVAAVTASFCVSPLICIVDRSIMQNASGAMRLGDSMKAGLKELLTKPVTFMRRPEFVMIWGLYAATYCTANYISTGCEHRHQDVQWPKFIATTAVNMTACISKDRAFTRMFGTTKPKALPIATYALFTVRDAATVAASFNMPAPASQWLQDAYDMQPSKADFAAQMVCPAAVQFLSTPLHLLGLDLYNNPASTTSMRTKFILGEYVKSVGARIARIGPAFGIGGVGNRKVRDTLRTMA
ncbi:unnamed protein product [Chrysoparadoxa australica]